MQKFDMHIHAFNAPPVPQQLITKLEQTGLYGACIFSNWPDRAMPSIGTTFEERLQEVLDWTRDYPDRLFPVLWIHPYEDDILEKIDMAVNSGVMAFKIICTDFYVYEEPCMKVLSHIASHGKPVFFHSGILWNGSVSSQYNRPLFWEALLDIRDLRFSMGHCSWPWIDECIALYGKFLNALSYGKDSAEMFFDITPGTPLIYREELLRKLYTVGYDVPDNIMFGSDGTAHDYNSNWTGEWLKQDSRILDGLGIGEELRTKLYCDNLLRFLGLKEKDFTHISPACDSFQSWYPGVIRN